MKNMYMSIVSLKTLRDTQKREREKKTGTRKHKMEEEA